jgi:hypothetical protein
VNRGHALQIERRYLRDIFFQGSDRVKRMLMLGLTDARSKRMFAYGRFCGSFGHPPKWRKRKVVGA